MDRVLQVSQINKMIKDIIDNEFVLENKRIAGEISSFSVTRNTAYFVIKDSESMLSCVMFNCGQNFNIGDNVIVDGSIKYYTKGGKLSLTATKIELAGQGELYQQFLAMKDKLEKEGLFEQSHKKPIPSFIKRVGVVTSRTGAVIQDIINVRTRRNPGLDIVLYDSQVQGTLAKKQIVEGVNFFSNYDNIDVVIVARGGGSLEDLQPFNEEEVARAVYSCKKPIISAVGHETDFTICDFVADLRVPTPSAAAELVAFDVKEAKNTVGFYQKRMNNSIENAIINNQMWLKDTLQTIELSIKDNIVEYKNYVKDCKNSIQNLIEKRIDDTIHSVCVNIKTLDNLNPARVLFNGYSVVSFDNHYVRDFTNIQINDNIEVINSTEKLKCKVVDKQKLNNFL